MAEIISTEGRIFVAQLTRDLVARQRIGADLLTPGTGTWQEALQGFARSLDGNGPIQAALMFKGALQRLRQAQGERACFLNGFMRRSRSGLFELLTYDVAQHPLLAGGREGVLVRAYFCRLQRIGKISLASSRLAFLSWHALARMAERSKTDIFEGGAIVAGCGFAGMIMRESEKHRNTSISLATEEMTAVGVLRTAPGKYAFFDVLTVLPHDADKPYQMRQRAQGIEVAGAVYEYATDNDADPTGRAEHITVIPFDDSDYVSIHLKKERHREQAQQANDHQP
jgi:hypothetical protein